MRIERPRFELTRVEMEEITELPEIIPVEEISQRGFSRRDFLGLGVGIASVVLAGCGQHLTTDDANGELAINPNGKTLASSYKDGTIKLWSLPDGKLVTTLEGPSSVTALAVSADGNTLASGSLDNTIKLWSLPDGKLLTTLEGSPANIRSLAIGPTGVLASLDGNGAIKLWSLPQGEVLNSFEERGPTTSTISALAISADGKTLASSSDAQIKLWSLPDAKLLTTLKEPDLTFGSYKALAISPDGKILASAIHEKVKLWSLAEGKLLVSLEGHHKDPVETLAISQDGKTLMSGDSKGVIISWNLEKYSFNDVLYKANEPMSSSSGGSGSGGSGGGGGRGGRSGRSGSQPCGAPVPPGAICTCNCVPVPSDREVKEAFETTNPLNILQRLVELPIQEWKYNWDDASVRHIGPMAQDFKALFGVGQDDRHIHPVDAQGVAFAAIQAVYCLLKEEAAQTECLQTQLRQEQEMYQTLKRRLDALEDVIGA
jgi:hypothetical protein